MDFPDPIPHEKRDAVFVGWDESWSIEDYVDRYLQDRGHPRTGGWREAVRSAIDAYDGAGVLRKSDIDYYLDANVGAWAPEPIVQKPVAPQSKMSRLFGILEIRRPGP